MDPILAASFAVVGVLAFAAFAYRRGYRAGLARGFRNADYWRAFAEAISARNQGIDAEADRTKSDAIATAQALGEAWRSRAQALGRMLRRLGYIVFEIEDPAAGTIKYRAVMTQPAERLPLGPSLS